MLFVWLPAFFSGFALVSLIVALFWLAKSSRCSLDSFTPEKDLSNPEDGLPARTWHEPEEKAFAPALSSYSPEELGELQQNRRRLLLCLRQLRSDFQRAWSVCRLLAPLSSDPEFGSTLVKEMVSFHLLYGLTWVQVATGMRVDMRVRSLVNTVHALRETAHQTLEAMPAHLAPQNVA